VAYNLRHSRILAESLGALGCRGLLGRSRKALKTIDGIIYKCLLMWSSSYW